MISSYQKGLWAERAARWFMRFKGYRILDSHVNKKNRKTGTGEIDFICVRGKVLVFCEVKFRQSRQDALYAVSTHQIRRLMQGAELFLKRHSRFKRFDKRFDVIAIAPWSWPLHLKNITRDS